MNKKVKFTGGGYAVQEAKPATVDMTKKPSVGSTAKFKVTPGSPAKYFPSDPKVTEKVREKPKIHTLERRAKLVPNIAGEKKTTLPKVRKTTSDNANVNKVYGRIGGVYR